MEDCKADTTVKPGKEKSDDVSKFRPISLLDTGGKVLEKLLINRINHHVIAHEIINKNQYGFTPQRSTTDAAMAVKGIVEEGLVAGEITVLISFDVKGAFDATWWPSILIGLKA
jgi:retron-type reverse transcriptase